MADERVPGGDQPVSHVSSAEWQSFEMRMRARRAERCLQRAAASLDRGSIAEGREALDEARQLVPAEPRIQDLQIRLDDLNRPKIEVPAAVEPVLVADADLDSFKEPTEEHVSTPELEVISPAQVDPIVSPERSADKVFEPVETLDWDTWRTPPFDGYLQSSRDRSRSAPVLAFGLMLFALVGWQAWAHKELWISYLPSPQPDVDSSSGLASGPPPSEAGTPSSAPRTPPTSHAVAAPQPDPEPVPEPVPVSRESKEEAVAGSASEMRGTTGDTPPPKTNPTPAINDARPGEPTTPATREPAASMTPRPLAAVPQPIATVPPPPDAENRSATTTPVAATPAPGAATPPAAAPFIPSVVSPVNPGPSRTEPAPSLPSPPPASAAPPAVRDQSTAIRAALNRYEAAYSRLDVAAVQSVWPSLDQHALSRAFDGLASQRVSLGNCSLSVNGNAARADCSGTTAWTPKVGGGERTASRKWTFDLSESDGAWRIVRVEAR